MKILYTYIPFQIVIGVVLGILYLPSTTPLFFIGLFMVLVVVVLFLKKYSIIKSYLFLGVIILFGMLIGWYAVFLNNDLVLSNHYSNFKKTSAHLQITLSKQLKSSKKGWRYYGIVNRINHKSSCGKVLIELTKDSILSKQLSVGDEIVCKTIIRKLNKATSPYDFDYKNYLALQKVYGKIKIDNYVKIGESFNLSFKIQRYRNQITCKLQKASLSSETKILMSAMLLGDKEDLSKEIQTWFTNAGVVHLIAISGMHVGVLYFLLLYILGFVKKCKGGLYVHVLLIIFCLWVFAIFSGMSSSVIRTVTMFSFILIAKLKDGKRVLLEPIISSMLVLLVVCPNYLFDVGFQLSYVAVISIVVFYPLCTPKKRCKNKVKKYFLDVLLVSVIAQLGVLPITLFYFHQMPLQFLATNFFAVSLLPLVLYGGFVVLIKILLWNKVFFIEVLYDEFIKNYISVIQYLASIDGFILKEISVSKQDVFSYYLVLFFLWRLLHCKNYKRWICLLITILFAQSLHLFCQYHLYKKEELIVYNNYRRSIVTIKTRSKLTVFGTGINLNRLLSNKIKNKIDKLSVLDRKVFVYKSQVYLMIDKSLPYEKITHKGVVLIVANNPKVNMERIIALLQPKKVILTSNNYSSNLTKWKNTCKKLQVPFYDISQLGAYVVN